MLKFLLGAVFAASLVCSFGGAIGYSLFEGVSQLHAERHAQMDALLASL